MTQRSSKARPVRLTVCLAASLLLACLTAWPAGAADVPRPRAAADASAAYASGEAIVRFQRGASADVRKRARRAADVSFESSLQLPRAEVVDVDGSVPAAVRRLERQPGVTYAQPNYRYEALAVEAPDDTFFSELWGLSDPAMESPGEGGPGVGALDAWDKATGEGQVIAILDTGVDLTHPDLEPNLWMNTGEEGGIGGADDDSNGEVDDIHGYDFVDDDGDPDDYNFHGTHVAGTAAAVYNNNGGIAGVAPEAEIMAVRVLDGDGFGSSKGIGQGIEYAAKNGADVINLSLGGPAEPTQDKFMSDAVNIAAAEQAVVVAAAGNEASNNETEPTTPCTLPQANLICVAALNQSGGLASFSNFGEESVDLAAPGTSILSAKTDYAQLFSDGFEGGLAPIWETEAEPEASEWALVPASASGSQSVTDSPLGNYGPNGASWLSTSSLIDLSAQRGCRLHYRTQYEIEPPGVEIDYFFAGAETPTEDWVGEFLYGTSSGYPNAFITEEVSISGLDGRSDVFPIFEIYGFESPGYEGASVDDVRLICRDATYINGIVSLAAYDQPDVGNYLRFNGTSMATPHVAGVAALVGEAEPEATATDIVDAIIGGTSAMPVTDPARRTATFGIADACQAIAVATNADVATQCPASSAPVVPPPPQPPTTPSTPTDGGSGTTPTTPGPPSPPDTSAPNTFFSKRPPKVVRTRSRRAKVVFGFGSDEGGVDFLCRVDRGSFRACSARLVRRFKLGKHVVRVKARDAAGNVDGTPAVHRFTVKRR